MLRHVDEPGSMFRDEARTLPDKVFSDDGLVLDADEWIRVKLYDEGEIVVLKPALFLLQLYHQAIIAHTLKIAAVAATAVFPIWSKAVPWYWNVAAIALGALGSIVADHRG